MKSVTPDHRVSNHYPILPVGSISDLQLRVYSDDQEAIALTWCRKLGLNLPFSRAYVWGKRPEWGKW